MLDVVLLPGGVFFRMVPGLQMLCSLYSSILPQPPWLPFKWLLIPIFLLDSLLSFDSFIIETLAWADSIYICRKSFNFLRLVFDNGRTPGKWQQMGCTFPPTKKWWLWFFGLYFNSQVIGTTTQQGRACYSITDMSKPWFACLNDLPNVTQLRSGREHIWF